MPDLPASPGQTIGPFFRFSLDYPGDRDLVPPGTAGSVRLHGHVYDGQGDGVPDAMIEIRQADASGTVPLVEGSLHRGGAPFTGWGRSTTDLLATLKELEARRVSLVALNGMAFDLSTPHGRMMATVLAGLAEFERELIQERIRSGLAAAKARGQKLGRQPGQRPKSDRLAPKVLALVAQGRSYRLIGREVGLSKNTVAGIVKRARAALAGSEHCIRPRPA